MADLLLDKWIESFGRDSGSVISIFGGGGKTSLMFRLAREFSGQGEKILTTTTTKIFMPEPEQSPETIITSDMNELLPRMESALERHNHISAGRAFDRSIGKVCGYDPDAVTMLKRTCLFNRIIVEADGAKQKPIKSTRSNEPVISDDTTHLILVTGLDALGKPLLDRFVHRSERFSRNTGLKPGGKIDEVAVALSSSIEMKKAQRMSPEAVKILFLNKADTSDRQARGETIARLLKRNSQFDFIIIGALLDKVAIKGLYHFAGE